MNWASLAYLAITIGLFAVFAAIVVRTYSRKREKKMEEPKHRMLDDE